MINFAKHAPPALPGPLELQADLRERLPQFSQVSWVESTGSTNADLMAQGRERPNPSAWPRLLGSHHQHAGRGRAGRTWKDQPGQALMFSCGFQSKNNPRANQGAQGLQAFQGLGPAIGVASCETLRKFADTSSEHRDGQPQTQPQGQPQGLRLRLKWPNDLMLDEGKLAGILIESQIRDDRLLLVIGMGLNLTGAASLSKDLQRPVAALSELELEHRGAPLTCDQLVAALARAWQDTVNEMEVSGFETFSSRFDDVDFLQQKPVSIIEQERTLFEGKACGVNAHGALLVQTAQSIETVTVGDVSVRLSARQAP